MIRHLRKTMIAGVVIIVPIVVSIKVLQIVFEFTDGILGKAMTKLLEVHIPGLGLLLFLFLIYVTGVTARTFFGKNFLHWVELLIERIPLIRTVYSGVKQLLGPFGGEGKKSFGKTVLVEYPKPGVYTYGFLTNEDVHTDGGRKFANVFLPFNHLHLGVVVMVDRDLITEIDVPFEDMVKLMASCGSAAPSIQITLKNSRTPAG